MLHSPGAGRQPWTGHPVVPGQHAPRHHLIAVLRTRFKAALQLFHRWRQYKNTDQIITAFIRQLARSLPVDIKQNVGAILNMLAHKGRRSAVLIFKNFGVLKEFVFFGHHAKRLGTNKEIILPVHFARAGRAGGNRNGHHNIFLRACVIVTPQ